MKIKLYATNIKQYINIPDEDLKGKSKEEISSYVKEKYYASFINNIHVNHEMFVNDGTIVQCSSRNKNWCIKEWCDHYLPHEHNIDCECGSCYDNELKEHQGVKCEIV